MNFEISNVESEGRISINISRKGCNKWCDEERGRLVIVIHSIRVIFTNLFQMRDWLKNLLQVCIFGSSLTLKLKKRRELNEFLLKSEAVFFWILWNVHWHFGTRKWEFWDEVKEEETYFLWWSWIVSLPSCFFHFRCQSLGINSINWSLHYEENHTLS